MSKLKEIIKKNETLSQIYDKIKYFRADILSIKNFKYQLNNGFNNDVPRIIFLVQYIPSWKKIESIYRILNDSNAKVWIVCVPSNIEKNKLIDDGSFNNDTYEYFKSAGYEAVNSLNKNGEWLDLKELRPDYVFYTRPFNDYMPQPYTSAEVSKYSKVCVILYAMLLLKSVYEIEFNNNFFKDVYYYFAETNVTAQLIKDRYKVSCNKGLRKVLMYGMPVFEEIINGKNEKNGAWKFAGDKFKIMWTPRWTTDKSIGATNFFLYNKFFLNYAENDKIGILVRPHPMMFDTFIKNGNMTKQEVDEYKNAIDKLDNIAIDEEKEYVATMWQSDVLVTDISSIIAEYFITEKPIIYCDTNMEAELAEYAELIIEGCYKVKSEAELLQCIERLRLGYDDMREKRLEIKQTVFGSMLDNCSNSIASEILKNKKM